MIRDRGKIKWQSAFFMPEHVSMLKKLELDGRKQKKPILDEQEYEEIGIMIMDSLNYALLIKVTVWNHGYFKHYLGVVSKVDPIMKHILLETENFMEQIMISDITAVERI
ncbi:YolD-like family protein [Bacillus sp. S/N-304-OC-R1]|uniref:YolD-like family protein n=1 Tax=Bacillus sp. S/N-304-OC-R1 TaxID=2758034 RepID=UPI001C8E1C69|nr:YolD-like family protein [Bacillus sp. S/N-304-OC-R1]MBY0122128.1 YolD-like family protein [Bacillus sp. S/N-304-OC-R1]